MKSRLPAFAVFFLALFLLSADLAYLNIGGNKIKYAYFLIVGLWLFKPRDMLQVAKEAVARTPRFVFLPLIPLAISIALSVNRTNSVLWTLWLGFDVFTVISVYAFLKAQRFSAEEIQACVLWALALVAAFGMAQFIAIYGFHQIIFDPQFHFEVYRINGIAGWPIFLNIFSFLLLPMVLLREKLSLPARVIIAVLVFVLVQSTAKTGWVLFVALGILLFFLNRRLFLQRYLSFLVPVVAITLLIPTPAGIENGQMLKGTDKVAKFSADLDLTNRFDSGTDRVLINELGLRVFLKHPWFGVGPKAYRTYILEDFDRDLPGVSKNDAHNEPIVKNENIWMELLSENGVLFTLGAVLVLAWALRVPRWSFANPLQFGAWLGLVLYFAVSGQFSQTALLTMVYAVLGLFAYARELRGAAWQNPPPIHAARSHQTSLDGPSIHPSH